jgi:hypothetical protein
VPKPQKRLAGCCPLVVSFGPHFYDFFFRAEARAAPPALAAGKSHQSARAGPERKRAMHDTPVTPSVQSACQSAETPWKACIRVWGTWARCSVTKVLPPVLCSILAIGDGWTLIPSAFAFDRFHHRKLQGNLGLYLWITAYIALGSTA